MRMCKNGSSLKLFFMVDFILGCRFWSWLCNLLMFPRGHFRSMKQLSWYLFHDLVNSLFMLLPYFLLMIAYRFSSKYARVRVAYVGTILVPIAVSRVWM